MFIEELTQQECETVLARATFGRLACSRDDQPYIVPVYIAFDAGYLYGLSTLGQKIGWMRSNPKICVQLDEFASRTKWTTVIVNGLYEELPLPQFTEERAHARELLQHAHRDWWLPSGRSVN